ncbi:hypothetical protein Hsc_3362 [Herbaspirillum seropedicae]|nr:hypothetical protein Hsc_3362 [Herbaspirillum seropedicae]
MAASVCARGEGCRWGEFEEASLLGLARLNALLAEAMPRNGRGRGDNDISDKQVML